MIATLSFILVVLSVVYAIFIIARTIVVVLTNKDRTIYNGFITSPKNWLKWSKDSYEKWLSENIEVIEKSDDDIIKQIRMLEDKLSQNGRKKYLGGIKF